MASIIKRKKNYSIVYNYTDENGETRQKWETRTSYQDALKRKVEVENQQFTRTFLPPTDQTIAEFLLDFAFWTLFRSMVKSGGAYPCTTAKTR